jgi:hypothetical protein
MTDAHHHAQLFSFEKIVILLISAPCVARITDVSHHARQA